MIINMIGGGGGLAFRVIGGTSAPSNPKPNDIWVNTNEKITSYIFSATEPEGYAEGMVWISTSTSSTIEFNALKKNGIQVYPVSAKQYISGAWVDKAAKTYQNGAWVDWWDGTLYDTGNEFSYVTGGWEIKQSKSGYQLNSNTQKYDSYFRLYTSKDTSASFMTKNKVDVSRFTVLNVQATGTFRFGLTITPTLPHDNYVSSTVTDGSTGCSLTLPTDGGEYYVWLGNYTSKTTAEDFKITKVWFE